MIKVKVTNHGGASMRSLFNLINLINMKKTFLLILTAVMGMCSTAQTLYQDCDEFTDKCYYYSNRKIVVTNETEDVGFAISFMFEENPDKAIISGLIVKMIGLGTCVENNDLYFMMEDNSRIALHSWNDFNCEGDAYFFLSESDIQLLRTQRLKGTKITNGRTYDSLTAFFKERDKNYLMEIISLADSNTYIQAK